MVEELEDKEEYIQIGLLRLKKTTDNFVGKIDNNKVVVLKHIKKLDIISDPNSNRKSHIIIQSENYTALLALKYTHRNKIDLVYVDPPYSIETMDLYGSHPIKVDDPNKHSKYINFILPRFKIAWNILKYKGLMVYHIDDDEDAYLEVACNYIFGEKNKVAKFSWRNTCQQQNNNKNVATVHEYIAVYGKGLRNLKGNTRSLIQGEPLKGKKGESSYRLRLPNEQMAATMPIHDPKKGKHSYTIINQFRDQPLVSNPLKR